MRTACYTADDFYSSDYPFNAFIYQFTDGSCWIHDEAQGKRLRSSSYLQCEIKMGSSDSCRVWSSAGLASHELLPNLQKWCVDQELELLLITQDAVLLEQARSLGIRCGDARERFAAALEVFQGSGSRSHQDIPKRSQLETLLVQHLVGRAFEDYTGEMTRIKQIQHLEIEFGESADSAIVPTSEGADVRKYCYVKALAALDHEEQATLRRFKIWVHARVFQVDGEWRFALLGVEN